jgi:hypothetical protein
MIKRKENPNAGYQVQGQTDDLVSFGKTPTVGVKLNRCDVQSMKQGDFKGRKGEPYVKGLYNDSIH